MSSTRIRLETVTAIFNTKFWQSRFSFPKVRPRLLESKCQLSLPKWVPNRNSICLKLFTRGSFPEQPIAKLPHLFWDTVLLTLIRVASQPTLKEWLVGILIPTDVGLLIPTTQCHAFGRYCKKRQKRLTLRARLRYLENSDQCIKWTSCSSLYAWSWSKNWGQSLKNLTLTELSKYRNFAAKSRDEKSTKGVALVFKDRWDGPRFLFGKKKKYLD